MPKKLSIILVHLTPAELWQVLTLVRLNQDDGGYSGNERQWKERSIKIEKKLGNLAKDAGIEK